MVAHMTVICHTTWCMCSHNSHCSPMVKWYDHPSSHHVKPVAQVAIHVVLFIWLHYLLPSKEDQSVNFEEFSLSNCVEITEFLFCLFAMKWVTVVVRGVYRFRLLIDCCGMDWFCRFQMLRMSRLLLFLQVLGMGESVFILCHTLNPTFQVWTTPTSYSFLLPHQELISVLVSCSLITNGSLNAIS
jgi:hypothetical protein